MASSPSRRASQSSQSEPKVFDVMRPGRAPVSATSRPVIVGHKPQVKDPMMSKDADDQKRSLMNANQKITVQPLSGAGGTTMDTEDKKQPAVTEQDSVPSTSTAQDPVLDNTLTTDSPDDAQTPSLGGAAQSGDDPTTPVPWKPNDLDQSTAGPDATPEDSLTPTDGLLDEKPTMPDTTGNNDLSSDDLAAMNTPSAPTASSSSDMPSSSMPETPAPESPSPFAMPPTGDQKPLPQLPEEHADHDMIVSHHGHGAGMTVLWVVILIVVALVVFNFLLDLEIITIDSFPHTDLL